MLVYLDLAKEFLKLGGQPLVFFLAMVMLLPTVTVVGIVVWAFAPIREAAIVLPPKLDKVIALSANSHQRLNNQTRLFNGLSLCSSHAQRSTTYWVGWLLAKQGLDPEKVKPPLALDCLNTDYKIEEEFNAQ